MWIAFKIVSLGIIHKSNLLTTLDVSKNTALTSLRCYYNQLTLLDISSQKSRNILSIINYGSGTNNSGLKTLKVNTSISQNQEITYIKFAHPNCIISAYTNSSAETPVCANYDPNGNFGSDSCLP